MRGLQIKRKDLLDLPVSIIGWILLREYTREYADLEIYRKLVSEYQNVCPLREMEKIMAAAERIFDEDDFRKILEAMFDAYHMK